MKTWSNFLVAGLLTALLMGCSGAGPSAADSRKDAENVAANGIDLDFFALDSVVRDNGWQEGDIYTVKHTLTYKMRVPYPEMLVAYAKKIDAETLQHSGMQRMVTVLGLRLSAGDDNASKPLKDWFGVHGKEPDVSKAVSDFLAIPISKTGLTHDELLRLAYLSLESEERQVPIGIKKGDPISYETSVQYLKTEKGWQMKS